MPLAFALSGGGARGDFQFGALKFMLESGVTPDIVSATSVGAINGAKIAEGAAAMKELQAIWLSLQTNRDMYVDEPWLASLSDDSVIAFFGAMAADIAGSVAGTATRWFNPLAMIFDLLTAAIDITRFANAVDAALKARSLYNLSPIAAKLETDLDPVKVAGSGVKLRLAVVGLETGELRYIDESGRFTDPQSGEAATDIRTGVLASASIPVVFPPVKIGSATYVDGGLRDIIPIQGALEAGADSVVAISASSVDAHQLPAGHFDRLTIPAIAFRAIEVLTSETARNESHPAGGGWKADVKLIAPEFDIHDTMTIDPGLISISIAYGYMRAADVLEPRAGVRPRLARLADAITRLRQLSWEDEWGANGVPKTHWPRGGVGGTKPVPSPEQLRAVRLLKWLVKTIVDQRLEHGGRLPNDELQTPEGQPGVGQVGRLNFRTWWSDWERHSWKTRIPTPWDRFSSTAGVVDATDFAVYAPEDGLLFREDSSPVIHVLYGGAAFPIPSLAELQALGLSTTRLTRVLPFDALIAANVPRDGTLLKERVAPDVYVIYGGAKFRIPDPAEFGALGFDWGRVRVLPVGAAASISSTARDGTLLKERVAPDVYVIYGGAKFRIPDPAEFDALGFDWGRVRSLPVGAAASISGVPRDGTLLKERLTIDGRVVPLTGEPLPRIARATPVPVSAGDAVYLMVGGQKCLLSGRPEDFGYFSRDVRIVPRGGLAAFPPGPPLVVS